jgi:paraquat-inducible protein B
MASPGPEEQLEDVPMAVVDGKRQGVSFIWLLPVIAIVVGGWLIYKTVTETGPSITISFNTAEGIEEGKTLVKFKDVKIGTVDSVAFNEDLTKVTVSITMVAGTDRYLTDKSRFWVVRPRVGGGEVSGLGTLISGAYIAIDPNNTGKSMRHFTGLETPPVITGDRRGTSYMLHADSIGSLSIGAPVYFRQFRVGEVTGYSLSNDHKNVEISIFIESPHDGFVHQGTHFWNASGINVSLNSSGAQLEMESLVSLLSGGIAFETPPENEHTQPAEENYQFALFDSHAQSLEKPITQAIPFALRFEGTVRGLSVGAPVDFRGIRVGTVKRIELGESHTGENVLVPIVIIDMEPQRMQSYDTIEDGADRITQRTISDPHKRFEELVAMGLRARMQTGNLVTGQKFVELDIYPNAEAVTISKTGEYFEIPTLPNSIEGIIGSIQQLLDKLDKADLGESLANLNKLMVSTSNLMVVLEKDAPALFDEMHGILAETQTTMTHASKTLQSLNTSVSPDGETVSRIDAALQEVAAAARSIRVMAEYLERHPEALLKGKAP